MAKITDLDQNLVGGNEKTNLVGETVFTTELDLKAKSVLQILRQFRAYILEHAVKGDTGATGLSIIGVSLSLTSSESTGNTYKMTCTLSDMSTINAGTFFVPKGDKGDTGATGATGNGIASITKTGTVDLVDTYRILFTDGTYFDFNVTNGANGQDGATGNGIASIVKTGTVGLVDSYTINFTDGTHFDYTVTNGEKGDTGNTGATGNGIASITKTGTVDLVDTYRITFTNGAYFDYTVTNGAKGDTGATGATGNGIASITKTGTSGLVDTYTITYTNGTTTTFTVTNGQDGAGTEIYVNGVAVSSVNFTSDPQTQLNTLSGGLDLIKNFILLRFSGTDAECSLETNVDKQIAPLYVEQSNGNLLTFNSTNNSVIIGAGVSKVKIMALIQYYQNSAATRFSNAIKLNGSDFNTSSSYISASSNYQYSRQQCVNITVAAVTENDVITFVTKSVNSNSANPDKIQNSQTRFLVEVIC